ncbi:MAG: glycosyltransferase [Deltaproteobacteria bacterium]|jgi:glycosyltransferase involved in cell wall biosynthesis|nr:glycosyltransferase [Deltaproteobacteria bacterium]
MNDHPSVSVIIPTYNRAEFLREAIDSVLMQSMRDFELIIVDDGSVDSISDVVNSFNDSRLAYVRQVRGGVSSARNLGVLKSSARLIAFLDSDDTWLPEKLSTQVDCFLSHPDVAICQTEEIWIRSGRRVNPMNKHKKYSGWIFEKCLPLCIISPSAVMMKRDVFDELGGFDESLPACEDYDLWLRATLRYPITTLANPLTVKRGGHADQLSSEWGLDRYRIKALIKILSDPHLADEYRNLVREQIVRRSKVVADGAVKRGNVEMYEEYCALSNAHRP